MTKLAWQCNPRWARNAHPLHLCVYSQHTCMYVYLWLNRCVCVCVYRYVVIHILERSI